LIQKVKIISNLAFDFKMGNRKMARAFVHLNHPKTTSPHGSAVQAKNEKEGLKLEKYHVKLLNFTKRSIDGKS
jgi:hypothetical protein